jgi:DNA invertase Pin-like site-specific DNA recombinase
MRDLSNYNESSNTNLSNDLDHVTNKLNLMNSSNGIIYGRVSTLKQSDGPSLETQKKYCHEYANKNNITIIDSVLEAKSAKEMKKQKGLIKLINNYDNIQHLVVYSPDRLSRNFYDFIDLNKFLDEQKVVLHFVKDNLISSNPNDLLQIRTKIQEAQNENETKGMRTKLCISKRKLNGTYYPSIPTYGNKYIYQIKNGKEKKQLEKNSHEQLIIKLIKELDTGKVSNVNSIIEIITGKNPEYTFDDPNCDNIYSGNVRYFDIARILNENDIKRRSFKWTGSSVKDILHMKN